MNRTMWIRQVHRWVSLACTVTAIIVIVALLVQEVPAAWVFLSPLLPLALLLLTGLYLFALPYLSRRRSGQCTVRDA